MNVVIIGDTPFLEEITGLCRRAGHVVRALQVNTILGDWSDLEYASDLLNADVVIEACHRTKHTRRQLVSFVETVYPPNTLLLVSALTASTTEVASWTRAPRRVIGYGLLPPLAESGMVELAAGLNSDNDAMQQAQAFWLTAGYEPVVVADGPGLVRGRLVACVINEAAGALQDHVADARDIDTAMTLGANYPHGPLAWADHLGLDVVLAIMTGLHEEWGEDRYRPAPLLRRMVLAGRLGKKTRHGFFRWNKITVEPPAEPAASNTL